MRRLFLVVLALAVLLAAGGCRTRRRGLDAATSEGGAAGIRGRVILLALDGLDPVWLSRWMAEGRLPSFVRLQQMGEVSGLRTTEPPTCEAAWTTFVTGLPPADSGVAGPWRVDPESYRLLPGTIEVSRGEAPPRVTTRRSGTAFWTVLAEAGVRVRVLWAPFEMPPERLAGGGEVLAGAGVPDLAGTPGRATLFAAEFPDGAAAAADLSRLLPSAAGWSGSLPGSYWPGGRGARMEVRVEVRRGAEAGRLTVALPGFEADLAPGIWGPRMPVTFAAGGLRVDGLARFLVLDAGDLPRLLAAPVEVDPASPWFPIAEPPGYAAELAERHGRVSTLGTPGDLRMLAAGLLPEEAYLEDLGEDLAARTEIILGELDRGGFELLVAFVPTLERVALGLQRLADPEHPRWDEARGRAVAPGLGGVRLRDASLAACAYLDDLVGRVAERLGPGDVLVIVSDHGLRPYRRAVHLNAWLRREGLLVLRSVDPLAGGPSPSGGVAGPSDIDWSRTQAYALGGAAIRINLRGREGQGIVEPGERYERLVERLAAKLAGWVDPGAGGARVVRRVLVRGRDLRGRREDVLPDLLVAFAAGYRESDETIAGGVPDEEIVPNRTVIGVDHGSGDAADLRGVFFSTRPLVQGDPAIGDVGATVLGHFGVAGAAHGRGRDLWRP